MKKFRLINYTDFSLLRLLALPRKAKQVLMVGHDVVVMFIALIFARHIWPESTWLSSRVWTVMPLLGAVLFYTLGLYRFVVRFANRQAVIRIVLGVSLSALPAVVSLSQPHLPTEEFSILGYCLLAIVALIGQRVFIQANYAAYSKLKRESATQKTRIAIYGAGEAGVRLAMILRDSVYHLPVAFLDDKKQFWHRQVSYLQVLSSAEFPAAIERLNIREIWLAIPSASLARRRQILNRIEEWSVKVKIVPELNDLLSGRARADNVRDIDIQDLLGRTSATPMLHLAESCIQGQAVMVTGAGGSIGSELCRQIITFKPKRLILFELCEYALYQVHHELAEAAHTRPNTEVIPILGNVVKQDRVEQVIKDFDIKTIYHAAAYKHVPMVECNIAESTLNNIFGTYACAQAALRQRVDTFVLISTDKAVRPTSVMGATKRCAELCLQALAATKPHTRFIMVRFGNVLGSSGSVVPLFRKQIQAGGPVTVTHPEINRFFMTIPEAAQLVLQAGGMGGGGDVFVLDMGEPVRILDLAERMIRLSGFSVKNADNQEGDIEIVFTGLRPGEKLYEELLIDGSVLKTQHPMIMRAYETSLPLSVVMRLLDQLYIACQMRDGHKIKNLLARHIEGYCPAEQPSNQAIKESPDKIFRFVGGV